MNKLYYLLLALPLAAQTPIHIFDPNAYTAIGAPSSAVNCTGSLSGQSNTTVGSGSGTVLPIVNQPFTIANGTVDIWLLPSINGLTYTITNLSCTSGTNHWQVPTITWNVPTPTPHALTVTSATTPASSGSTWQTTFTVTGGTSAWAVNQNGYLSSTASPLWAGGYLVTAVTSNTVTVTAATAPPSQYNPAPPLVPTPTAAWSGLGTLVAAGPLTLGQLSTTTYSPMPGTSVTTGGDLTGQTNTALVVGLQGNPLSSLAPTNGQALIFNGIQWAPSSSGIATAVGGDLSGLTTSATVIGIQNNPVSATAPNASGQTFIWSGTMWTPGQLQFNQIGGTFTPTQLGCVSISTPSTCVMRDTSGNFSANIISAALNGNASTASAFLSSPTLCPSGQFPNGVTASGNASNCTAISLTAGGDVSGMVSNLTVVKIQGNSVTAGVPSTSGQTFVWSGSAWTPAQLLYSQLGGTPTPSQIGCVSTNSPSTCMARDASGNFAAGTITAALNGTANTAVALLGTPSLCPSGQFPNGINAFGNALNCTSITTNITQGSNITVTPSGNSVIIAVQSNPTFSGTTTGTFMGNITGNVTGNVSGSAGSFTGSLAGQVSGPQGTTVVNALNGTSAPTNSAADQVFQTTATATGAWKSVPDCPDTAGNHLNYVVATHTWACGDTGGTAGSVAFSGVGGGTNANALLVSGSLNPTGSGAINANQLNGTALSSLATGVLCTTTTTGVPYSCAASDIETALGFTPPSTTGTGASGTWGISVTGSAGTATTVTGSFSGDIGGTQSAMLLPNIVAASTNTKLTYNAKGQVTAGAQAQFSDIGGTVSNSQLTNSGVSTITAGTNLTGGGTVAPGGAVTLNLSSTLAGALTVSGSLAISGSGTIAATTVTGSFSGDIGGTQSAMLLPSIVTGATNTKLTYNAKGQVTAGAQAQFSDIGGTVANSQLVNSGSLNVNAGTNLTGGGGVVPGGAVTLNLASTLTGALAISGSLGVTGGGTIAATTVTGSFSGDIGGTQSAMLLPNIVTGATNTKLTYNAKGQVTAGAQAQFSDIGGTASNSQLTNSGALTVTAGTGLSGGGSVALGAAVTLSMPSVGTTGTYTKVTTDAQGRVSSATNISASDVNTALGTNGLADAALPTNAVTSDGTGGVSINGGTLPASFTTMTASGNISVSGTATIGTPGTNAQINFADSTGGAHTVIGTTAGLELPASYGSLLNLGTSSATSPAGLAFSIWGGSGDIADPGTLASTSLNNGTFSGGGTDWTHTADCTVNTGAMVCTLTTNTLSGATQTFANMAIKGVAVWWYAFNYTINSVTGSPTAHIGNFAANSPINVPLSCANALSTPPCAGPTVYFKSAPGAQAINFSVQTQGTTGAFSIGAFTLQQITGGNLSVAGTISGNVTGNAATATYLVTGGAQPTLTLGAGAGTGPSYTLSLNATDTSGVIALTTGTSPSTSSVLFTMAWGGTQYPVRAPGSCITRMDGVPVSTAETPYIATGTQEPTTTGWGLTTGSTALTGSTTYFISYQCI